VSTLELISGRCIRRIPGEDVRVFGTVKVSKGFSLIPSAVLVHHTSLSVSVIYFERLSRYLASKRCTTCVRIPASIFKTLHEDNDRIRIMRQ
jgi:hypothetical protein